jgi:hypothetical protein
VHDGLAALVCVAMMSGCSSAACVQLRLHVECFVRRFCCVFGAGWEVLLCAFGRVLAVLVLQQHVVWQFCGLWFAAALGSGHVSLS